MTTPTRPPVHRLVLHSPLGPMTATLAPDGALHALCFDEPPGGQLGRPVEALPPPTEVACFVTAQIQAYFSGNLDALSRLTAQPPGSPWQQRVWAALRALPPGQTLSYGALAEQLGGQGRAMARAVGSANRSNPVALIIPCHRVVAHNGQLQGYAWGLARKAWLLAHEQGRTPAPLCPPFSRGVPS